MFFVFRAAIAGERKKGDTFAESLKNPNLGTDLYYRTRRMLNTTHIILLLIVWLASLIQTVVVLYFVWDMEKSISHKLDALLLRWTPVEPPPAAPKLIVKPKPEKPRRVLIRTETDLVKAEQRERDKKWS